MNTPWGTADQIETIADGITFVSTPSHGGYLLSPDRVAQLPASHRAFAAKWSKEWGDQWYEEDCAALAVVVAFPVAFGVPDGQLATLRENLSRYIDDD